MFSQTNHVISEQDKADAKDLVQQLTAKLNIPVNLPIAGRNRQGMGQASSGYVKDCIGATMAFPAVPSGEIDAKLMQTKLNAFDDFAEINAILQPLAMSALNLGRLHGQDLMVASNSIKDSFASAAKNRVELKATAEKLKQRYARAKKDEAAAKKTAKDATQNSESDSSSEA